MIYTVLYLAVFNLTVCHSLLLSPEGGGLLIHSNELVFFGVSSVAPVQI